MDSLRNLVQEGGSDGLVGREVAEVDGDEKLLGLRVDITNIDTTLVGEVDPIALMRQCQRSGRAMIGRMCSSCGQTRKSRNTRARTIGDTAMQGRKGKLTCENGRARARKVCAPGVGRLFPFIRPPVEQNRQRARVRKANFRSHLTASSVASKMPTPIRSRRRMPSQEKTDTTWGNLEKKMEAHIPRAPSRC